MSYFDRLITSLKFLAFMERRNFLNTCGLLLGSAFIPPSFSFSFQDHSLKELRNNIGYFTERGGTILWFVSPEGIALVDSQFPASVEHLLTLLAIEDRTIDVLFNTHHHRDHSSGNIVFESRKTPVVAHRNSKKNQAAVAKRRQIESSQYYPSITFDKNWTLSLGQEKIRCHYFGAAHTDGDAVIHFENSNICHVGDLVFNRRFPYIDKTAGANIENWIAVLEQIQKTFDKDTSFIFGHCGPGWKITGSLEDVKAMRNYLIQLLETVRKALKAGQTRDAIMTMKSIPQAEEWQGKGIERSLTAAYEELALE